MIEHIYNGPSVCEDGHIIATFDMIVDGKVYEKGCVVHPELSGEYGVIFTPDDLRDYIESDHANVHMLAKSIPEALKAEKFWEAVK